MLYVILEAAPAPLHRLVLRIAHAVRKRYWRVRRPRITGCRVLVLDREGRILLVRHSYEAGWMLPGGGVARREEPLAAARRELLEETGCAIAAACEVAVVTQDLHGAANTVHVIAGRTRSEPHADRREITAARFFAPDALPADLAARLAEQIPAWIERYQSSES